MKDIEIFRNEPLVAFNTGAISDALDRFNNSLDGWHKVKVPVKHHFIDELTEITEYEWRYRLYVKDVYEALGLEACPGSYSCCYWEKDVNGKFIGYYLL